MFESYINKNEMCRPRTPKEFIEWFGQKLEITKEHREELKEQIILHKGIAKKFYEELFPLYCFLQHKKEEWHDVRIEYIPGDQNFDVKVESSRGLIPKFIEITQADRNEEEYLRMRHFLEQGTVSTTGKVTKKGTKRTGLRILIEDEMGEGNKSILEKIEQIKIAINNKVKVAKRPDRTALLVYFDDCLKFPRGKGQKEINDFLSKNESWREQYMCLFIVSASGDFFWERIERNNG